MSDVVKSEREDILAGISLNRPEVYNSISLELLEMLTKTLIDLAGDENIRGIIITGEGKAFCAGGDLKWIDEFPYGPGAAFSKLAGYFNQAVLEMRKMAKPVIAAINGVAAGAGFSLALACDFRVMDESASLRQAYTSSGLTPDGGGTFYLPKLVGMSRAMEILTFDEPISSQQALEWGLVNRVVSKGQSVDAAKSLARKITMRSLNSFIIIKKLLTESYNTSFETHIERERTYLAACGSHPEGQEGIKAFLEKRKPVFTQL